MKTALTIAGSDPSGGAGIQADLKTFAAHGVFGMSVITAVVSENTVEVKNIMEIPPEIVTSQAECVFSDIFPDAVKIGMTVNEEIIIEIEKILLKYKPANVVIDPVMVATNGSGLFDPSALSALVSRLFKLADIITPNIPEAETLSGIKISGREDMLKAARIIGENTRGTVMLKGGHLGDSCDDLLYNAKTGEASFITGEYINNPNSHGTGCTLSSAAAANLALGADTFTAAKNAKEYVRGALLDGLDLGRGRGPLNHMYKQI